MLLTLPFTVYSACKCNCNPEDASICASSYDLDHPCPNLCAASPGVIAPMLTACPREQIIDPLFGIKIWRNNCPND